MILPKVGRAPVCAVTAVGLPISGDGGVWLPLVLEPEPGRYWSALAAPGAGAPVALLEPVWSRVEAALHYAARCAASAAA